MAGGELEGVAGEFEGFEVKLRWGEIEGDESLDAVPEAAGVVKKASDGNVRVVHDLEGLLKLMLQFGVERHGAIPIRGNVILAQQPGRVKCKTVLKSPNRMYDGRLAHKPTGESMHICLNRATAGGGLGLEAFLRVASAAGFPGADVDMGYGEAKGAGALRELYGESALRFGGWGLPFDFRAEAGAEREGILKLAAQSHIAAELGIDSCATWLMPSSELPFMENWAFHVSRLKPAAKVLADCGLRLGLEFIGPYHHRRSQAHEFVFTPGQMLELADAIGENVGLLVDSFHVHTSGTPWEQLAEIPAKRIVLVHLNDAPGGPVASLKDFKRELPGEGVLDLCAFLGALEKTGYAGPVSLEVFSEGLKAMPAEEAAKRAWSATRKALGKYAG